MVWRGWGFRHPAPPRNAGPSAQFRSIAGAAETGARPPRRVSLALRAALSFLFCGLERRPPPAVAPPEPSAGKTLDFDLSGPFDRSPRPLFDAFCADRASASFFSARNAGKETCLRIFGPYERFGGRFFARSFAYLEAARTRACGPIGANGALQAAGGAVSPRSKRRAHRNRRRPRRAKLGAELVAQHPCCALRRRAPSFKVRRVGNGPKTETRIKRLTAKGRDARALS